MVDSENPKSAPPSVPHTIWISLEAPDVIELKRFTMDRDGDGAVAFFREVLTPLVRAAAKQRCIALDMLKEEEK